ncbi:MAG TPA: ferritin-like domain-containing protein [Methanomassiliicoccales archaeon]|nr:ferritin-like domain-containing protein [Methanomassiliicoccales archaeon]HXZ23309.1 ferritin-like domain-containing protein [Methanomassiliicoccales archaeon]
MASQKLLEWLNKAIAAEMQVSIQYMWQHVQWSGVEHYAVADKLEEIAIEEMKHAEKIAERLWYLGGVPTTKPAQITVGGELYEMIEYDAKAEADAIEMYKHIEEIAEAEGDVTTRFIFEGILEQEEEHHDFFISVMEGKKPVSRKK